MKKFAGLLVEIDSGLRRLAKFKQVSDGSVYVTFAPSGTFSKKATLEDLLSASDGDFEPIEGGNKISLHSSKDSQRINQVGHRTCENQNLFTAALKQDGLFTPFIFQAVSDLKRCRHAYEGPLTESDVVLTKINSAKDTLFIGMLLGPVNQEFDQIYDHPSNLNVIRFEKFNVWIIWSLFNFPATKAALNFRYFGGSLDNPLRGLENWQIYNLYTDVKQKYADAYFRTFLAEGQ